jgi:pilus assembly protein Flp/PilA
MTHVTSFIRRFVKDEEAATMPEYALMIALIAVVCIAAVTAIGTNANTKFTSVGTAIGNAGG